MEIVIVPRYSEVLTLLSFPSEKEDRMFSATVLAPDAARADALATAFFVLGVAEVAEVCRHMTDVSAILVERGERAGEVRVHAARMADVEWECFEPSFAELA